MRERGIAPGWPFGWLVLGIAAAKVGLHLATGWRYGFHRDELYYVAGGLHPSFGYVDHPPLVPLLGGLIYSIFGASLLALRAAPAIASGVIVLLAVAMVVELDGGRTARWVAALLTAISPVFLVTNGMFQTVTFDQMAWAVVLLLVLRLLRTGDERIWLAIGLALGIGLMIKYTIGLLIIGLVTGLLLTSQRRWLQTRWPYLGAAITFVVVLPNLIWQMMHGLPTLEFIRNNSAQARDDMPLLANLGMQVLDAGPLVLPLVIAGGVLLFRHNGRRFRLLGIAVVTIFIVHTLLQAKFYYTAPLLPLLYAAGSVWFEGFVARRRWSWQPVAIAATLVAITLIGLVPLMTPVLPASTAKEIGAFDINGEMAEMIGWPEFVDSVEAVYLTLPPDRQANAVVLTGSYGEAAVLELLDDDARLPEIVSAHNSYAYWRSVDAEPAAVIVTGYGSDARLDPLFEGCQQVGTVTNELEVENEIFGTPIHLCGPAKDGIEHALDQLEHFR